MIRYLFISLLNKISQQTHVKIEIKNLKNNLEIPKSNALHSLNPFLDTSVLLRMGYKLSNVPIKFEHKYPIIHLDHKLIRLLIVHEHLKLLHAN